MRGIRKQAHPARPASAEPGTPSGSWSPGTPPARQPEDENRAPATLVDATFHATADAGSIPAVSIGHLRSRSTGRLFGDYEPFSGGRPRSAIACAWSK